MVNFSLIITVYQETCTGGFISTSRGVYPKGASESNLPHFKSGGLIDWSFGLHIFDRLSLVVALGISVMPIVNRDYLKLVLLHIRA